MIATQESNTLVKSRVNEVDFNHLEFGKYISDSMLVASCRDGEWSDAEILPYGDLILRPASLALHYGQTVFEGMKAFRMQDGRISIFRIEKHYERFVKSLDRMCMSVPSREMFVEGMKRLITQDAEWVPDVEGASLYIRPFVFASEERFGVKISGEYRFVIFTGPVPELYATPIKVRVEQHYNRASRGGTGFAKCGGNYGASYFPTREARMQGYEQVLWTDSVENRFIEESGMMNVLFVIDDVLVTPPLSDSILDGVTRDSLLQLAGTMDISTEERRVSIDDLEKAFRNNSITEAFGAGTAAVIAPIKTINIRDTDHHLRPYSDMSVSSRLKKRLQSIRFGVAPDLFNWNTIVDPY